MMNFFLLSLVCLAASCSQVPEDRVVTYVSNSVDIEVVDSCGVAFGSGRSAFGLDDHFVWGGSVIKSVEDGKYYMIYSGPEAGVHSFNNGWVYGSKMGIAVSDIPDGNFKHLKFFYNEDGFTEDRSSWDAQTTSNPHIRRFGDKYYLYYIGGVDDTTLPFRSKTDSLDKRSRIQQSLKVGLIIFDTFEDLLANKFTKSDAPILSPRTRVKPNDILDPSPEGTVARPDNIIVVNPSVVYRPSDSKYLLYFKGNIYDPHWRGVHGVALSDSPEGPFVAEDFTVFDLDVEDGVKLSAEDPYAWYSEDDKLFYAVFKDFTGKFTKGKPGLAIMYSEDGIDWMLPKHSLFMSKELTLPNGEIIEIARLERPQILLDENGEPSVLYAACSIDQVNNLTVGNSFNIQIGLSRK